MCPYAFILEWTDRNKSDILTLDPSQGGWRYPYTIYSQTFVPPEGLCWLTVSLCSYALMLECTSRTSPQDFITKTEKIISLLPCHFSAYQPIAFPMGHRWMGPPRQCNLYVLHWVTWANGISFHGPSWCGTILEQKHWIHPKRMKLPIYNLQQKHLFPRRASLAALLYSVHVWAHTGIHRQNNYDIPTP